MDGQEVLECPPGKEEGWPAKRDNCADHEALDLLRLRDRVSLGRIVDAAGDPLTTPPELVHLYAIDLDLECWIALETVQDRFAPDAVKHDTLLRGRNVYGAGEMRFDDGWLVVLNLFSGTYQVDAEWTDFVWRVVESHGVRMDRVS